MTLRNKLDITDEIELAHEEERVSKLGALALYRDGTLDTLVPGTFSALKAIHVALFGDIYDLAGRVRTVDWSRIGREDYLLAMERSPVRDLEIKALLGQALSDDLHSVALLARSIDASYAYEGYDAYRAEELGSNGASGAVR